MAAWTDEHEDLDTCSNHDLHLINIEKIKDEKEKRDFMIAKLAQENLPYSRTAEVNRCFIFSVFDCLRSGMLQRYSKFRDTQFDDLTISSHLGEIPLQYKGLYLFYECVDDGGKIPLYIGYTGQSFRARFRIHRDRGAIKDFSPKNKESILKADLIPTFFPMHAKLLESVFLLSFDFCMNKEENDALRKNIKYDVPKNDFEISRRYFDIAYDVISGEVSFLSNHYKKSQSPN